MVLNENCEAGLAAILKFIEIAGRKTELRQLYLVDHEKNFTRKRKLCFSTTILFIFNLIKKSLSAGLLELTSNLDLSKGNQLFKQKLPPTKSAFVQARKKIKIKFFEDLFALTQAIFYEKYGSTEIRKIEGTERTEGIQPIKKYGIRRWNKFRLVACDGTSFQVPDNPENREKIGIHKNQHGSVASCKIVAFHDVLNRVFLNLFFHKREKSELTVVHEMFEKPDTIPSDVLMIYDRAYEDSLLLARHLKADKHCIIRIKESGNTVTKNFLKSGKKEAIVDFKIGERAYRSARYKHGLKNHFSESLSFKIRLIRVDLKDAKGNAKTEVLATTLLDQERYDYSEFQWLYSKRWGIETAFDEIKNQLKLGVFSGYHYQAVMQDIWSVFSFYNIRSMLIFTIERQIEVEREEEYRQKNKVKKQSSESNPNTNSNTNPQKSSSIKLREGRSIIQDLKEFRLSQINRNIAISVIRKWFFELFNWKTQKAALDWVLYLMGRYREPVRERITVERVPKLLRCNNRHITEKNYKPAL